MHHIKTKHNSDTLYQEHLAKLILEYINPGRYGAISNSDKPDLRGSTGINIEVTIIDIYLERFASSLFEKLRNKTKYQIGHDPKLKTVCKQLYNKKYELIFIQDKVISFGPKEALIEDLKSIKEAYCTKANKISSYNSKTIDLFMYSPVMEWYDESEIEDFAKWVKETANQFPQLFEKIYIFAFKKCYEIDTMSSIVSLHIINDAQITLFMKEAMDTAGYKEIS